MMLYGLLKHGLVSVESLNLQILIKESFRILKLYKTSPYYQFHPCFDGQLQIRLLFRVK